MRVVFLGSPPFAGPVLDALLASPRNVVIALATNTGFAHAANVGIRAARSGLVALVNTDVVLASVRSTSASRVSGSSPIGATVASLNSRVSLRCIDARSVAVVSYNSSG